MKQKFFFSVCAGIMCLLIGCQKEETNNLNGNDNIRKANTVLYFNEENPSVYYDIETNEAITLDGYIACDTARLHGYICYDNQGHYSHMECESLGNNCGRAVEYNQNHEQVRIGMWCKDGNETIVDFQVVA